MRAEWRATHRDEWGWLGRRVVAEFRAGRLRPLLFLVAIGSILVFQMVKNKGMVNAAVRRALARAEGAAWVLLSPEDLERRCGWVLRLNPRARPLRLRNARYAAHPQVVARLTALSYDLRLIDPAESLKVGLAAADTADALDLGAEWARLVADLRAHAWGNVANCQRLVGNFSLAHEVWGRIAPLRDAWQGEPRLAGNLARWEAALLLDQGKHEPAAQLYDHSASLFAAAREPHEAGKSRLGLAITHFEAGEPKRAIRSALGAADLLDYEREPEMALAFFHNMLSFLEADHQPELALAVFPSVEHWYGYLDSPLLGYRAQWLRSRLHLAAEEPRGAAVYGDLARRGLMAEGQTLDAALAGFDAALGWMQVGGFYRVQHLAQEMYEVFTSHEIPREAAGAFQLFADAARTGRADLNLLRRVAKELEPLRRPGVRHSAAEPEQVL